METKNPYLKQELEVVFSPELNRELRYCFDPTQLEKIKYRPVQIDAERWQCSCGAVCEGDACPSCGMQKTLAFGKINARYLEKHRAERMEKMSALVGKPKKADRKKTRAGTVLAVAVIALIAAGVVCLAAWFGSRETLPPETDPPLVTTDVPATRPPLRTSIVEDTTAVPATEDTVSSPDTSSQTPETSPRTPDTDSRPPETISQPPETTSQPPETTSQPPETTSRPPETTSQPPETTSRPPETTGGPSVVDSDPRVLPSGNLITGGLVYCAPGADYTGGDSLVKRTKDGRIEKTVSNAPASSLCGFGDSLFYLSGGDLHEYRLSDGSDSIRKTGVSMAAVAHETLYCVSGLSLFRLDGSGETKLHDGTFLMMEQAGGRLYFSTTGGMYRVSDASSGAVLVSGSLAHAVSVCEFDDLIFYNVWDQLMAYRERTGECLGVLGLDGFAYNAILHCGGRVCYRAVKDGKVSWFETDTLFTYKKDLGISTYSLFITDSGYYDGDLRFIPAS